MKNSEKKWRHTHINCSHSWFFSEWKDIPTLFPYTTLFRSVLSFRKNSRVWTTCMRVSPIFFRFFHKVLLFFIFIEKSRSWWARVPNWISHNKQTYRIQIFRNGAQSMLTTKVQVRLNPEYKYVQTGCTGIQLFTS